MTYLKYSYLLLSLLLVGCSNPFNQQETLIQTGSIVTGPVSAQDLQELGTRMKSYSGATLSVSGELIVGSGQVNIVEFLPGKVPLIPSPTPTGDSLTGTLLLPMIQVSDIEKPLQSMFRLLGSSEKVSSYQDQSSVLSFSEILNKYTTQYKVLPQDISQVIDKTLLQIQQQGSIDIKSDSMIYLANVLNKSLKYKTEKLVIVVDPTKLEKGYTTVKLTDFTASGYTLSYDNKDYTMYGIKSNGIMYYVSPSFIYYCNLLSTLKDSQFVTVSVGSNQQFILGMLVGDKYYPNNNLASLLKDSILIELKKVKSYQAVLFDLNTKKRFSSTTISLMDKIKINQVYRFLQMNLGSFDSILPSDINMTPEETQRYIKKLSDS